MKQTSLTIAAMLLFATGAAHAQSSVTLYGLIDTDMAYASNAHTGNAANPSSGEFSLNSGGLSTSRWGLRGNEDLGGGLSAVFDLENGFTVNNGAAKNGGDLFGRQAWVGSVPTSTAR
jgi:predicted porin